MPGSVVYKIWFNNIGIVITEDGINKRRKARIGVVKGTNETLDTQHIVDYGMEIPIPVLKEIIKVTENKNDKVQHMHSDKSKTRGT